MVELKFVPDNRNYFQVDGKELHDAPTPAVSVRCPHCRELGSFEVVRKNAFRYSKHGKMYALSGELPHWRQGAVRWKRRLWTRWIRCGTRRSGRKLTDKQRRNCRSNPSR